MVIISQGVWGGWLVADGANLYWWLSLQPSEEAADAAEAHEPARLRRLRRRRVARAGGGRADVWLRWGGASNGFLVCVAHRYRSRVTVLHFMFWPIRTDACMQHMAGRVSHPYQG